MSVSHSESSFREAMLSRQSSLSKAKFQQVSSISTMDTVSLRSSSHLVLSCPVPNMGVFKVHTPGSYNPSFFCRRAVKQRVNYPVPCSRCGATWSWILWTTASSPATLWEL